MSNQTNLNFTLNSSDGSEYELNEWLNTTLESVLNYNNSDHKSYDSYDLKISEEFLREFLICSDSFGAKQFSITRRQIIILKLCICLSIICLLLTLLVYSVVPRLRNVPGKCLMSLSVAKITANLCFLASHLVYRRYYYWLCRVLGILRHYFILTTFVWTVVIAVDCYRTFRSSSKSLANLNSVRNHSFLKYSLLCWSTPALFIAILIIIEVSVKESIFKANYGLHVCSISSCEAFLMFGVVPIGAILMVNVIYFVLILHKLKSASNETELVNKASLRAQCIWYTKLALILGLTWVLTVMAIFIPISHIFFYTHAFSSLQGVMIFYAFTCRANVCHLLRRRLNHHMRGRTHFWQLRRATQTLSRNQSVNTGNDPFEQLSPASVLFQIDTEAIEHIQYNTHQ